MKVHVHIDRQVVKGMKKWRKTDVVQVMAAIDALVDDPFSVQSKQLTGEPYRSLRVGHYRVIYQVIGDNVYITKAAQREEVYKR